jgi:hypothetical protein
VTNEEFFLSGAPTFSVELVCRYSFWAVRVRNVLDEVRMFVLVGEVVGLMKLVEANCFLPGCRLRLR